VNFLRICINCVYPIILPTELVYLATFAVLNYWLVNVVNNEKKESILLGPSNVDEIKCMIGCYRAQVLLHLIS
jgi:hypothetical protein